MTFHKAVLKLHLWMGLASAVFLLILGVTGSILIFAPEVSQLRVPKVQPQGQALPVPQLWALVQNKYPGARLRSVALPTSPTRPIEFHFQTNSPRPQRGGPPAQFIYVNPYTGALLGAPPPVNRFMVSVERLHVSLWAGKRGRVIVAYATLVGIFLILTGLILWWPRQIWWTTKGASWRRFNFDLHSVVGIYTMVFFFAIAFTGAMIHWSQIGEFIIKASGAKQTNPQGFELEGARRFNDDRNGVTALSLEDILKYADRLPRRNTVRISMPPGRSINVVKDDSLGNLAEKLFENGNREEVAVRYVLNANNGDVLQVQDQSKDPWAVWFRGNVLSIHEGTLFGWTGRIVACLSSTGVPVMTISGFIIWWKRKMTERQRKLRKRATGQDVSLTTKQIEDEVEDEREDLDRQRLQPDSSV